MKQKKFDDWCDSSMTSTTERMHIILEAVMYQAPETMIGTYMPGAQGLTETMMHWHSKSYLR